MENREAWKQFFDRSKDLNALQTKAWELKREQTRGTLLDFPFWIPAFRVSEKPSDNCFKNLENCKLSPGYYIVLDFLAVQSVDLNRARTTPGFIYLILNGDNLCLVEQETIEERIRWKKAKILYDK